MGRIAKLIKTEIEKFIVQIVEMYKGANVSVEQFAPSGDDSPPLESDRVILVSVDGTGNYVSCGVLTLSQKAKPGEKILFSRNKNGEVKAILKLLNDGNVKLETPEDINLETEKNLTAKVSQKIKIEAAETELTGGQLKCKGVATPTGKGCFCALSVCPVTGSLQTGDIVMNT